MRPNIDWNGEILGNEDAWVLLISAFNIGDVDEIEEGITCLSSLMRLLVCDLMSR